MTRSRAGIAAIWLLALCWVAVIVPAGANQTAHLATVHALARGSANIDRERHWTGDTAYFRGHFFAAKAPGLALATTPYFLAIERSGLVPPLPSPSVPFPKAQGELSATALWEAALFGAMLPGFVLLVLVRRVANAIAPGYGSASAVAVGGASILGIMATMFFDHVLSACLAFAAFAVLRGGSGAKRSVAAGCLAGLAVAVELPLAIAALVLGAYALAGTGKLRSAGAYSAGVVIGLVPLLAFNTWAFGSPVTLAYSKAVAVPGVTGHDVLGQNSAGFFGVGLPRPHGMVELLFSSYGLLVLAPIWAFAVAGIILMRRDGRRAEAHVVTAIILLFFFYNAGYVQLFGAMTAGPRFLVPTIPFLALPLAVGWRRAPLTAWSLCIVSAVVTWTIIAANPMGAAEDPGTFFHRLQRGSNTPVALTGTVLHWIRRDHTLLELVIVLSCVGVAIALAVLATPIRFDRFDAVLALCTLVAWRVVYTAGPTLLKVDKANGGSSGAGATTLLVLGIGIALYGIARSRVRWAWPAVGLLPLLWAPLDGSPRTVAALAAAVLAAWAFVAVKPGSPAGFR